VFIIINTIFSKVIEIVDVNKGDVYKYVSLHFKNGNFMKETLKVKRYKSSIIL